MPGFNNGLPKIAVCVTTYGKKGFPAKTLRSIIRNGEPKRERYLWITVLVDNNPTPTSQGIVSELSANTKIRMLYRWEPRAGIPFARNACIKVALDEQCDYIAFIDDDEIARPGWLEFLFEAMESSGADVVSGQVYQVANGHLIQKRSSRRRIRDRAETDNVLFRTWIAREFSFDESMTHTGGTDTLFFRQVVARGGKIVFEPRSKVVEVLPLRRQRINWHLMRHFRYGITHVSIEQKLSNRPSRLRLFFKALVIVPLGLLEILPRILCLQGKNGVVQALQRACRGLGIMAGLMNRLYEEYKNQ